MAILTDPSNDCASKSIPLSDVWDLLWNPWLTDHKSKTIKPSLGNTFFVFASWYPFISYLLQIL